MARVPTLTGPSVAPEAAPNIRLQNPVDEGLLSIRDRQLDGLGQAVQQTGDQLSAVHAQLVDQANALRVDDAYNQAQERALRLQHGPEEGYTNLKGYDALKREGGQPLPEEYTSKLDQSFADISAGLGNERQRAMFAQRVNGLRTNFLGNAMQYTAQQAKDYGLSVREASVSNAANALVLNFSDPTNVAYQTSRIRASIEGGIDPSTGAFVPGSAQMAGKSASWAKEKADEAVSGAHIGAIQAAMEAGNVNGAMAYRQKYAGQLTASDMLKVDGVLQRNYDTMRGATVANQVMTSPPVQASLNPTDFDRFRNVIVSNESGGRRYGSDGKILEGPNVPGQGTAKGEMQVMDATFAKPGYGVKGADPAIMANGTEDQKAAERARVGNEYLAALVKEYNGDMLKAAAAYNWGPGNVDKAIKETQSFGNRPDGSAKGTGFLGILKRPDGGVSTEVSVGVNLNGKEMDIPVLVPTLSKDEVNKVLSLKKGEEMPEPIVRKAAEHAKQRLAEGKSVFAAPEESPNAGPNAWLALAPKETQDYVANVQRKMGNPALSAPPRPTLEQLQGQAVAALGPNPSALAAKTAKDQVAADYETQTKAIKQRADETVAEAMQALVQNGGRFSQLTPALRTKLTQQAPERVDEVMSYGQRIAKGDDTTNNAVYLKLSQDPVYLKNLTDAQFFALSSQLSQSDFQHFANQRGAQKQNTTDNPGNLDTAAVSRSLNSRLQSMGIDPTPKDGTADAQRLGAIRRVVDAAVMDGQRSTGKKFTDAEVAKTVDELFAKSVTFRKTFLGFDRGTDAKQVLGLTYGDIPSAQREQIEKAFKASGISSPSEGDVLGAYMAGKIKGN